MLRRADLAAEREGPLRDAFERLAAPERARLTAELPEAKRLLAELDGQHYGHMHFEIRHPEALRRLNSLDHQIAVAAWELDAERQDIDGIGPGPIPKPAHERAIGLGFEREGPELERSIGLEIGL